MTSRSQRSSFLHPASGLLILGADWLLFTGGVLALGLSTPVLLVLGGVLVTGAVAAIQSRYGADGQWASWAKGLVGGIAVSLPLPVAGTGLGGLVLALSGLNRLRGRSSSDSSRD
jgi:hypothetical protein